MSNTPLWARFVAFGIATVLSIATVYLGSQTHDTSEALRRIEQSRLAREKRDAEVAEFIGTYYAVQCDAQIGMMQFPLYRWVGIQTPVQRGHVQNQCDQARGDEPTRVLEQQTVVGRLGSKQVRVFASFRFANDGRPKNDTGEIAYVDLLLERASASAPYKLRSIAEVRAHAS